MAKFCKAIGESALLGNITRLLLISAAVAAITGCADTQDTTDQGGAGATATASPTPSPHVYTGKFAQANPMVAAHKSHTSTLLADGNVLITGSLATNAAEIFDSSTGQFKATGSALTARANAQAVLLGNGDVLVAGGDAFVSGALKTLPTTEIYSPATGAFTAGPAMNVARSDFTATTLQNGKILIAGGMDSSTFVPTATAELYDPSTQKFTMTGNMSVPRAQHQALLLSNGKVLIMGGVVDNQPTVTDYAELYDPASGTFSFLTNMTEARAEFSAITLPNGNILVAGGVNTGQITSATAELFNVNTSTFTSLGMMISPRSHFQSVVLANGKVLLAGGQQKMGGGAAASFSGAEIFDPATNKFSATGSLNQSRSDYGVTMVGNGEVLFTGGADQNGTSLSSAEIY